MPNPKEKRFLKYWADQKDGGKRQYIIVYTIGWTFLFFFIPLALTFVLNMYSALRPGSLPLWAAIPLSVVLGFVLSQYLWNKNERKEKEILMKQDNEK